MIDRHLITTAHEGSWKFDCPVLFLTSRCCLYGRSHVWKSMNYEIASPFGLSLTKKMSDLAYLYGLAKQLFDELTIAFNTFHNTNHSRRYWEIMIGHWLHRYVAVIFNRYFTVEQALRKYKISSSTIFDDSNYTLSTSDSNTFLFACNDDIWNHVLYSKVLKFFGGINLDIETQALGGATDFHLTSKPIASKKTKFKNWLIGLSNKIFPLFSRNHDAFIINSYLPKKEEIKLYISMGQFPQIWKSPELKAMPFDKIKRQSFYIDSRNHVGFEKFVRTQLNEIMPICFLEGYEQLLEQSRSLPWPRSPKFIFTSNNFDKDEIFKVWTGSMVEAGVPYFTGQHGNNGEKHIYHGNSHLPERTTADKFIAWSDSDLTGNVIPAFNFKVANKKRESFNPKGRLLLIELYAPFNRLPWDNYFEFEVYQQEQFSFADSLPTHIQQELTVRLHLSHTRTKWDDEKRWRDRMPSITIETGLASISDLITQSRLIVHSYDSTGILETLDLNIPTLCFWNGGLDFFTPSARSNYEVLRDVGILQDSPEQAAKFIALHWDDINTWWQSPKVQTARKFFCSQYSKNEKKPILALKNIFDMALNPDRK